MAYQAAVGSWGRGDRVNIHSPVAEGVLGNLAEFASDTMTLAELQTQLAAADMKEAAGQAAVPVALAVAGLGLVTAALPIALMGLAELLTLWLGAANRGWAYLIVAGVALVLGGLLAWLFGRRIGASLASFNRSREELSRNVSWIKTVLAYSGRRPAQKQRNA